MRVYNRYIYRSLLTATVFVSLILVTVTLLTQSLRFLELIVESGASTWSFWMLTFLSLPRFFEVIIPIGLATAVLFLINRMFTDSELSVLKATGFSHWQIARPVLISALVATGFLLMVTLWLAPSSLSKMQILRQIVQTEFSSLLFREGVFTNLGRGLTLYSRERGRDGELEGLIIHDARNAHEPAQTIYAKRGVLAVTPQGQQVIVYDGSRQDFNVQNQTLQRLSFERYTIDLPEERGIASNRWREPEERTFWELLNPDLSNRNDANEVRTFLIEAHLRILSPFLTPAFCLVAVVFLILGMHSRQGQMASILAAIGTIILLQSLFVAFSNMAYDSVAALLACYALVIVPASLCLWLLRVEGRRQ